MKDCKDCKEYPCTPGYCNNKEFFDPIDQCEFYNECKSPNVESSLLCLTGLKYACSEYHWKKTGVVK